MAARSTLPGLYSTGGQLCRDWPSSYLMRSKEIFPPQMTSMSVTNLSEFPSSHSTQVLTSLVTSPLESQRPRAPKPTVLLTAPGRESPTCLSETMTMS